MKKMLYFWMFVCFVLNLNSAISIDTISHRRILRQTAQSTGDTKIENLTECGVSSITKIVPKRCCDDSATYGNYSRLVDWPWTAELLYRNYTPTTDNPNPKSGCEGSLISKDWVITSAHCVVQYNAYVTLQGVRLGDLNLVNGTQPNGTNPIDVQIDSIFVHPKFSLYPRFNDIALLHLKNSVSFTEYIHPICISNGKTAVIGRENIAEGELSTALQDAAIHLVDTNTCAKNYQGYHAVIDDRVLCIGGNGSDSCHSISGGPLAVPLKNRWNLIGIVSYHVGCGDPNFPGVYTRLAAFSDWMVNITGIKI